MKRLLALILVAFTFAFVSVASINTASASPKGDVASDKPEAAMDAQMKGSKDTADADKAETKAKKHKGKGHKKAHKKKTETTKKEETTTTTTETK